MINKRLLLTTVVLLILSLSVFAAISGTGERKDEILPVKGKISMTPPPLAKANGVVLPLGVRDTLVWVTETNTNFGGWTDDYFAEYFVPETDGILHGITFNMSDLPAVSGGGMAVWLYSSKYHWPEIKTVAIRDSYTKGCHLGYYQTATGKEAYGEPTEWVKGSINTKAAGAIADKIYDPLGEQLVPAIGAITVNLDPTPTDKGWVTADLDASGDTYNFTKGETLMVLIRFNGFPDKGDGADYRMGFYSAQLTYEPQPGLKFYAVTANPEGRDGNSATDDWGWHIRSYAWDWRLYVEWTGDRPPVISDITAKAAYLTTNPITISATIVDDNPGGGPAGVASANLYYSTDGTNYTSVTMTSTGGDVYTANIPGQVPGTTVYYYIEATDNNGNARESWVYSYVIFKPTHPTLFVYDDGTLSVTNAKVYYWYGADPNGIYPFDTWPAAYGPVTTELLNNYEIVVHVMGGGPTNQGGDVDYNVYKTWLAASTAEIPHRLFIDAQDYGWISGFEDTTFNQGDFEYDYLGVQKLGPQDVPVTTAKAQQPWRIDPVQDNVLTGSYYAFQGDSVKLFYYPYYELGFGAWQDNITPTSGTVVDFTDPDHGNAAVGVHNSGTNWKTVFWTVDYLALSFYDPADTSSKYHWGLTDAGNLLGNVLTWFGAPVLSTKEEAKLPKVYSLKQNFPNPFNPTTAIEYALPEKGLVKLTIYNMLGQEVRTLVNTAQEANTYRVVWNGLDNHGKMVPSGIYFYTINANNFTATKKMVFMK